MRRSTASPELRHPCTPLLQLLLPLLRPRPAPAPPAPASCSPPAGPTAPAPSVTWPPARPTFALNFLVVGIFLRSSNFPLPENLRFCTSRCRRSHPPPPSRSRCRLSVCRTDEAEHVVFFLRLAARVLAHDEDRPEASRSASRRRRPRSTPRDDAVSAVRMVRSMEAPARCRSATRRRRTAESTMRRCRAGLVAVGCARLVVCLAPLRLRRPRRRAGSSSRLLAQVALRLGARCIVHGRRSHSLFRTPPSPYPRHVFLFIERDHLAGHHGIRGMPLHEVADTRARDRSVGSLLLLLLLFLLLFLVAAADRRDRPSRARSARPGVGDGAGAAPARRRRWRRLWRGPGRPALDRRSNWRSDSSSSSSSGRRCLLHLRRRLPHATLRLRFRLRFRPASISADAAGGSSSGSTSAGGGGSSSASSDVEAASAAASAGGGASAASFATLRASLVSYSCSARACRTSSRVRGGLRRDAGCLDRHRRPACPSGGVEADAGAGSTRRRSRGRAPCGAERCGHAAVCASCSLLWMMGGFFGPRKWPPV